MVTPHHVQAWLDSYIEAWKTYDPDRIGDLFSAEATYAYHPWGDPIRGRAAIVADWLSSRDDPDSWDAEYSPLLIEADRAVARGTTRYTTGKAYENLWEIDFGPDGRCTRFVEWYMVLPDDAA